MKNKTSDEIYEYVLNYKNNLINSNNISTESIYNRANDIDIKIGSDLLILASAGIAVTGGIITSVSSNNNTYLVIALILSMSMMSSSIICGVTYYLNGQKFWERLGDYSYEEGRLINNDNSKTVEELEVLLKKIKNSNHERPNRFDSLAKKIQIFAFVIGVIALCVAFIFMLIS